MAKAALKTDRFDLAAPPEIALAESGRPGVVSPARTLQRRLSTAFDQRFPDPEIKKLPAAVRLALPFALSGALWAAIIMGARALLRL